jgi:hypothetical protein
MKLVTGEMCNEIITLYLHFFQGKKGYILQLMFVIIIYTYDSSSL